MTRRVLVVDDDRAILEVVAVALARVGGWEVTTAASGEEALALALAEAPDAILLDVMMPGLDGPGTLTRLQADPATRDIPVVVLTAKVAAAELHRWDGLGVAGVVTKPFDPLVLPAQVGRLLGWAS